MACPHASGLAALILTMRDNLSGKDVRDLIEDNVQNKPKYECQVRSGGLIDLKKTILAVAQLSSGGIIKRRKFGSFKIILYAFM